jgi:hypothetical protein
MASVVAKPCLFKRIGLCRHGFSGLPKKYSAPRDRPAIQRQKPSFQVSIVLSRTFRAQASDMSATFPEDKNRVISLIWLVGRAGLEPATRPL